LKDLATDLLENALKLNQQLSKLAMSGFGCWPGCSQKLVFTYDNVKAVCPDINTFPNGFGLLQAVQHYAACGARSTTPFSFLSSWLLYVSTLPSNEQIVEAFYLGKSEYIWLMYVGMVGIKSENSKVLLL